VIDLCGWVSVESRAVAVVLCLSGFFEVCTHVAVCSSGP
jgi:hypothetical protein